jgi:hypothetical protein
LSEVNNQSYSQPLTKNHRPSPRRYRRAEPGE